MPEGIEPPAPRSASQRLGPSLVLGMALLVGFSITLQHLLAHWVAHPWSRYSLAFVPLLAWAIYRDEAPQKSFVRLGALAIGLGLIVQFLAVKGAVLGVARPTLATTTVAFLLMRGVASARCALLALWIVPVPHIFMDALGGAAAGNFLFGVGAAVLSALGVQVAVEGGSVVSGGLQLDIDSVHGGYVALVQMLGLGWFWATRRQLGFADSLRTMALFALFALPIQFVAVIGAVLGLAAGSLGGAVALLESIPWVLPLVVVVWRCECRMATAPSLPR